MELQFSGQELLQFHRVGSEAANALSEFFGSAGILVHFPAEGFFIEANFLAAALLGGFHDKLAREVALGFLQFFKQVRTDGEQVAAGQLGDFAGVPEARAHHLRGVVKFLVVVVDARDRLHTRIFCRSE